MISWGRCRPVCPSLPTRSGSRAPGTVKAVSAAVREFYEFHRVEGRGPQDLVLTRNPSRLPRRAHSFLAHIEQRHPSAVSRLTWPGKQPAETVQLIDFEADFATLLAAASTHRDRLLLALYDLGLRVGQALGLRHADLDPMRKRVQVCRREDNANGRCQSSERNSRWPRPAGSSTCTPLTSSVRSPTWTAITCSSTCPGPRSAGRCRTRTPTRSSSTSAP